MQGEQPQSTLSTFRFEGVCLRHWVSGGVGSKSTISTFTFSKVCRKFLDLCKVSKPNQRYLRSVLKGLVWDIEWVGGVRSQSTLSTFTFSKVCRKFLHVIEVSNPNQQYLHSVLKVSDYDIDWVGGIPSQSTLSTLTFQIQINQSQSLLSTFAFRGYKGNVCLDSGVLLTTWVGGH